MKRIYSLVFLLFCWIVVSAQTGTIRIKKPEEPKKELPAVQPVYPRYRSFLIDAGTSYTFKRNDKLGSFASISYGNGASCGASIGLGYSMENIVYALSGYNSSTHTPEIPVARSHTQCTYLTMPLYVHGEYQGGSLRGAFLLGLVPKYMVGIKNEHERLDLSSMNRFNLALRAKLMFPVGKWGGIGIGYSKDLFQSLRDRQIDSNMGTFMGFQRSKTGMVTLSLYASLRRII